MGSFIGIVILLTLAVLYFIGKNAEKQENQAKEHARVVTMQANINKTELAVQKENIAVSKDIRYSITDDTPRYRIVIDNENKNIHIFDSDGTRVLIPFKKLMGCEVLQDKQVVDGVSRAIAGGLLAGGAAAIVGALTAQEKVTSLSLIVSQDDLQRPRITMDLIVNGVGDIQRATAFANDVTSSFNVIIKQCVREEKATAAISDGSGVVEQLKSLKSLLDEGIITQEEFDAKKKQLLGL